MSLAPLDARQIEIRSLRIGIYASACMAVAGICVHVLSGSYALLLDGLYSAVMVGSGLVASRISRNVVRPPDQAYPYGYDGQEALYVLFRSLVLIGVLSFAAMSSLSTLIDYVSGSSIPVVTLAPVAFYSTAMVAICWGLAWRHHDDWIRSGRQSQLLLMEARAARIDALISGLTGIALLGSPLLKGTPLAALSPITDSLLVLVVSMVILKDPVQTFLNTLGQAAGGADGFCGGVSHPNQPMDGAAIDLIRERIEERCRELLATPVRSEVILTATPPFSTTGAS